MPIIKGEKRELSIKIRVTQDEKDKLNELKTQDELAAWMRELALSQKPIKRADPNLVRAIGRIGSNLNQIAKHVNTNKQISDKELSSINRIESILIDVINEYKGDSDAS
jgi:ABC-type transporter Mla subunit MlaD